MSDLKYKPKPKNFNKKVNQLSPRQRRAQAVYIQCCHHCGSTQDLLTFKRADGRDITICRQFAITAGYIARGEK